MNEEIMHLPKHLQEHLAQLKKMGFILIGLALFFSLTAYFLPTDETLFWLTKTSKKGVYVISIFFCFLGLYCLGAIWRKRHFI